MGGRTHPHVGARTEGARPGGGGVADVEEEVGGAVHLATAM